MISTVFLTLAVFVGYRYFSQEEIRSLQNKQIPLESIPLPQKPQETVTKLPVPQIDQSSDIVDRLPETVDNTSLADPLFQQQLENAEKDSFSSNNSATFFAPNERESVLFITQ